LDSIDLSFGHLEAKCLKKTSRALFAKENLKNLADVSQVKNFWIDNTLIFL